MECGPLSLEVAAPRLTLAAARDELLYFVVLADGEPVGMQDLIGQEFAALGPATTFSWLRPGQGR